MPTIQTFLKVPAEIATEINTIADEQQVLEYPYSLRARQTVYDYSILNPDCREPQNEQTFAPWWDLLTDLETVDLDIETCFPYVP